MTGATTNNETRGRDRQDRSKVPHHGSPGESHPARQTDFRLKLPPPPSGMPVLSHLRKRTGNQAANGFFLGTGPGDT